MVTFGRALRFAGGAASSLALVCALTACGAADDAGTGAGDRPAASASGQTSAAGTELQITVTDGDGARTTWQLTCDPAGGTHPDPEAACAALAGHPKALRPVAKGTTCTMQYGGADTATVSGTVQGQTVNAGFSLSNGCEIGRWQALVPLLPATGSAGANSLDG